MCFILSPFFILQFATIISQSAMSRTGFALESGGSAQERRRVRRAAAAPFLISATEYDGGGGMCLSPRRTRRSRRSILFFLRALRVLRSERKSFSCFWRTLAGWGILKNTPDARPYDIRAVKRFDSPRRLRRTF